MTAFSAEAIFAHWSGIEDSFAETVRRTFNLPTDDDYLYRAESFAMTLAEIQDQADKLKYKYQSHGKQIEVVSARSVQQKGLAVVSPALPIQNMLLTADAGLCRHSSIYINILR